MGRKIDQARIQFLQDQERMPTEQELSELTGYTVDQIEHNQRERGQCRSLDAQIKAGEDTTFVEIMQDKKTKDPDFSLAVRDTKGRQWEHLLSVLSDREATVLALHYGIGGHSPTSLSDIGDRFGLSRERARQIRDRSIRKLRIRGRNMEPALS